jgi:hypothetical protein
MPKLTCQEEAWIAALQFILDCCPSDRLGFFTTGDPSIYVHDRSKEAKINDLLDSGRAADFCIAVEKTKAKLATITFPHCVHSTAG